MAAKFPKEPATQPELMEIAREIPANKIDIFATRYLNINDTQLTHIKHGAGYESIQTNFKCLLHWCRNTEEPDARQALCDKLSEAVKEGLVTQEGADILKKHHPSTEGEKGKEPLILGTSHYLF